MSAKDGTPTPRTDIGERIAANAALLRLFQGEYRDSGDRHNDALVAREYFAQLERELAAAREDSELLDWLNSEHVDGKCGLYAKWKRVIAPYDDGDATNIRAALRAARTEPTKEQK